LDRKLILYSTVDTNIEDAKKDNRQHLVDEMKGDKQKHLRMLMEALEKEAKEQKLNR
jgi:hypothetical protein